LRVFQGLEKGVAGSCLGPARVCFIRFFACSGYFGSLNGRLRMLILASWRLFYGVPAAVIGGGRLLPCPVSDRKGAF